MRDTQRHAAVRTVRPCAVGAARPSMPLSVPPDHPLLDRRSRLAPFTSRFVRGIGGVVLTYSARMPHPAGLCYLPIVAELFELDDRDLDDGLRHGLSRWFSGFNGQVGEPAQ